MLYESNSELRSIFLAKAIGACKEAIEWGTHYYESTRDDQFRTTVKKDLECIRTNYTNLTNNLVTSCKKCGCKMPVYKWYHNGGGVLKYVDLKE